MEIFCNTDNLVEALNTVSRAVSTKSVSHILRCIVISVEDGKITLFANNQELAINTFISCDTRGTGCVALESDIFANIVRKLPFGRVEIYIDDEYTTTVKAGKSKFTIRGVDAESYPQMPEVKAEKTVKLRKDVFREMINGTSFAAAVNSTHFAMNGELFQIGERFRIAALDGQRVALRETEIYDTGEVLEYVIPANTLKELVKIMDGHGEVEVTFSDKHTMFVYDDVTVVSRLIGEKFFDIGKIINSESTLKVTVDTKMLNDCLERTNLLATVSQKKPVVMEVTPNGIDIKMTSEIGSLDETIEAVVEGEPITIGFNGRYVQEALKTIEDEQITIYMSTAKSPIVIKDDECRYLYVILPVNIGG